MMGLPLTINDADGSQPPANPGGCLVDSGDPDASGGVAGIPAIGGTPPSALLDPEKQPDNADDGVEDCRLLDEWVPPPEYQIQPISDPEARFMHSSHHHERKAIYHALRSLGCYRQLHRYVNCGAAARVEMRACIGDVMEFRVVACCCHNRWCPRCARGRSTIYANNIRRWISDKHRRVRFMTLTLRHNDTPVRDQVSRLLSSLLAIRRRSWWKAHVYGGVAFVEIKIGGDNRYHVHAHLLVEGVYCAVNELSAEWHAVTGDSPIVDIRDVRDPDVVAGYVAKYASKPIDRKVIFQERRLCECITALHGRRLATTFGSWVDLKLNQTDADDDPASWRDAGSVAEFLRGPFLDMMIVFQPVLAKRIIDTWTKFPSPSG